MDRALGQPLVAKTCYGHLGGKLGDMLFQRLVEMGWFAPGSRSASIYNITPKGCQELSKLGVDISRLPAARVAAKMAGPRAISEKAVKASTDKSSTEWYAILDEWDAKNKGHTLTAKYLEQHFGLSGWWAQSLTVRYEWERGLRTKVHRDEA